MSSRFRAVPEPTLMGEVFTDALPTEDPVLFGHADISPRGAFEARSIQTFNLTYTAGRYGLDDTGSIRIVFRFTADGGDLQMDDPTALNYVSATTSASCALRLGFSADGHVRPWYQALTVRVSKGYLREGDWIKITLGDTSGGSPGMRLQSMCETAFTYRVLADCCATGHYHPIAESPTVQIAPGQPAVWKAVIPTLRRPGERFRLGVKAEDLYGNPSDKVDATLTPEPSLPVAGLPDRISFKRGQRAVTIDNLAIPEPGILTITLRDSETGEVRCRTNPMTVREGKLAGYWGDMHGQSGESVGLNTAREYFDFARNLAFLDATSHQANDFQINHAFWSHINELTAEYHEDGRFLTLPGYEWSGNTGVGGDRNVYFREEGRVIHRSSHALIKDRAEILTDSPTAQILFQDLADEDCVVYAHIGGRPADVAYAHDARLETAMEIHSAWGTFEWLMADCFALGYRVGVVANSDGHKGRPGASYPGASQFGAYGGLTCFLMENLTRDDWFTCLRNRHHYATTGNRMSIDLYLSSDHGFDRYPVDPMVAESTPEHCGTLVMGNIATCRDKTATLSFSILAGTPIERVEVLNGMETLRTIRNKARPGPITSGGTSRYRILWRGAMVKGRGARASWNGRAVFEDCEILKTREINAWNPDRVLAFEGQNTLTWSSVTAGNFGAFDVWLKEGMDPRVSLETEHLNATVRFSDIQAEDYVLPAGGLDLELRLFRLPDALEPGALSATVDIDLHEGRDDPIWIRVTTEDGFQAWTSPVYLI